jgi:threonine dehydrogenase-like Zn-dependent dehydrogenase
LVEKVRAAVAVGAKRTELQRFGMPDIEPDAGLLEVEAVGVCGTDWAWYSSGSHEPRILGHHTVGRVAEVGAVASKRWGVETGDRIALEEYIPCGHCELCRSGEFRLCDSTDPWMGGLRYGSTPITVPPSLWGGYSEYQYLHPNSVLHKVPDHVPASEAALTLPLSNGFEWVCFEGGAEVGSTVVVQGPGQQGLSCVLAAREAGAGCVIVSGLSTDAGKLALASRLGADYTVDVQREDLGERIEEITGGAMADLVIDAATGGPSTVESAIQVAKKQGTVLLGGFKRRAMPEFYSDALISKRLTVRGVRGHSYKAVELALRIIASGKHPLGKMCTHQYALDEVDEALKTVGGEGVPGAIHVTVTP